MVEKLRPADEGLALRWTEKLTGIPVDSAGRARAELRELRSDALDREILGRNDIDSIVAAYLLWEAFEQLSAQVDPARLRKKLRREPNVWSLFAEFHVARLLRETLGDGTAVELEPGRSAGRQPDWGFTPVDEPSLEVEVKAVGLSDDEAAFCARVAPALEQCLPGRCGVMTLHAPLSVPEIRLSRDQRRHGEREAARMAKRHPPDVRQLSAAIISAKGAEEHYLRRLGTRVAQAVQQTSGRAAWPALLWNNGASTDAIAQAIDWDAMPDHVEGIAIVGTAVTFPIAVMHHFRMLLPREAATGPADCWTDADVDVEIVQRIYDDIQGSAGVRAMLLGVSGPTGRPVELLRRDGSRRVLPFNFYVDPDPPEVARRSPATG